MGAGGVIGTVILRGAKGIFFRFIDDAAQFIPLSQLQRLRELPKRELKILEAALEKADSGEEATKLFRQFIAKHDLDKLVTDPNKSRKLLSALMKPLRASSTIPRWVRTQAHHIIPVEMFNTPLGRKLHDLGVDLNGIDNGIWLPVNGYKGRRAALHTGKHVPEYTEIVRQRFSDAGILRLSGEEGRLIALQVIKGIEDDLLNRRILLQKADSFLP